MNVLIKDKLQIQEVLVLSVSCLHFGANRNAAGATMKHYSWLPQKLYLKNSCTNLQQTSDLSIP